MKNFYRRRTQFSQCGLNCLLCPMQLGKYCPGCGGGDGNQSCALARCAVKREVKEFCIQCSEFPCVRYKEMMEYDSFVPHSKMLQDLKRAEVLGIEVYIAELKERRIILDQLLSGWNDGRRKTFYCAAVYLLELEDLNSAFEKIKSAVQEDSPIKEKALTAVKILQSVAEIRQINLKLNKKTKEK